MLETRSVSEWGSTRLAFLPRIVPLASVRAKRKVVFLWLPARRWPDTLSISLDSPRSDTFPNLLERLLKKERAPQRIAFGLDRRHKRLWSQSPFSAGFLKGR